MYLTTKRALVIATIGIASFLAVTTSGCVWAEKIRETIKNPPTTLDGATDQDLMDEIFDRGLDRLLGD